MASIVIEGTHHALVATAWLARETEQLLLAHRGEHPLLLPNGWDVASARAVAGGGFPVVARSSRAIAQVLGEAGDDSSDPDVVFSFVTRIARAVSIPVTADLEAGLHLSPSEPVDRMLDAAVEGCNLEDTDPHDDGALVDADRQAAYLADIRAASERPVRTSSSTQGPTHSSGNWATERSQAR